ncbi:MAG: DUF29 domain-containing protein [Xenococcaceae cyanobacterium MO_188.B32]|nr:DUF29 domain-containing protein [Xenococcaceae cyanobacterium MO_188.B32]
MYCLTARYPEGLSPGETPGVYTPRSLPYFVEGRDSRENVESMGRSEKSALVSNLQIVLMHLLKHKYQPDKRSNSWLFNIFEHRDRVLEAFEVSPSLKLYFREVFPKCYAKARKKASLETGLPISTFPTESPFTPEETLDPEYLPD